MLTAVELSLLAAKLKEVLPLVEGLAEMDVAGAEANVARLKVEGPSLIAHYKLQAKREVLTELGDEIAGHRSEMASEREQLEKDRAEVLAKARTEAGQIIAEARREGEQLTAKYHAAHSAAQEALR